MSPITAANCVNVYLHPSGLARFVALVLTLHIACAILVSPLPLVAMLFLFGVLFAGWPEKMVEQISGELRLFPGREIQWQGQRVRIDYTELRFRPLQIVLRCENGLRLVIWRDACAEAEYRHLLVLLSRIA